LAAAGHGERAAVAAELRVPDRPDAIGCERGVAGEIDGGHQTPRHVGRAEIVDTALPTGREVALVYARRKVDLRLAAQGTAGHGGQGFEAGQIDCRAHFAPILRRNVVAVAFDAQERHDDFERSDIDLFAGNICDGGVYRDGAGLGQAGIERRKLQILHGTPYADHASQLAVRLEMQTLPGDALGRHIDRAGVEAGLESGVAAIGHPAETALCGRRVAGLGRQFGRAVPFVASGRELQGDVRQIGPLHQRRHDAPGRLVERDVGRDPARRPLQPHVGGELARGASQTVGRKPGADFTEVAGDRRLAADLPVGVDAAESGRKMEIVDPHCLQVDVEGELEAAARGRAFLLFFLRRAQHIDLRGRQQLDTQPALQQRCERPGKASVADLQPGARAVGDFDARHAQVCRHETVDAGDADLLIRRGGEAGGH